VVLFIISVTRYALICTAGRSLPRTCLYVVLVSNSNDLLTSLDYLTFWYRTEERSIRVAFILASATLAGAFGGAIAYGVGHMNNVSGLSAWRCAWNGSSWMCDN